MFRSSFLVSIELPLRNGPSRRVCHRRSLAWPFQVTNGELATFQFSLPELRRDRDTEEIRVSGLGGGDTIRAEGSFNVNRLHLNGGDGNDTLIGSDTRDLLSGGKGNDNMNGRGGTDELRGGEGDDTMMGGDDSDALYGESGDDEMNGGAGADTSYGGAGKDKIHAGPGFVGDLIDGGADDDSLVGGPGIDTIRGQAGDDTIQGGGLNDVLFGGDGNDILHGGTGRDLLDGGIGADTLHALNPTTKAMPETEWEASLGKLETATSLDDYAVTLNAMIGHLATSDSAIVEHQRNELNGALSSFRARSANDLEVIASVRQDINPQQTSVGPRRRT